MLDAAAYYESQAVNLGTDLLSRIDDALDDIREGPERWPIIGANIRRRLIPRFPYAILYKVDQDEIVIIAVMHLHRRPGYWINRL